MKPALSLLDLCFDLDAPSREMSGSIDHRCVCRLDVRPKVGEAPKRAAGERMVEKHGF